MGIGDDDQRTGDSHRQGGEKENQPPKHRRQFVVLRRRKVFDQQVKYDPENQSNDNAGSPMGIAQVIIKPVECQHGAAEHESDGETLQFGLFVANHDSSHEKNDRRRQIISVSDKDNHGNNQRVSRDQYDSSPKAVFDREEAFGGFHGKIRCCEQRQLVKYV